MAKQTKDKAPVVDKESAALLKDLEKQGDAPEADAKAEAEADAKAEAEADAKAEADGHTVTNCSKNPRRIGSITIAVGDSYTMSDADMQNEALLRKVDRCIELGVLREA